MKTIHKIEGDDFRPAVDDEVTLVVKSVEVTVFSIIITYTRKEGN